MIVRPWFSRTTTPGAGKTAVYHYHLSCASGKRIEKANRRPGTDDRALCQQCSRLSFIRG
jgi:hypothetical protein